MDTYITTPCNPKPQFDTGRHLKKVLHPVFITNLKFIDLDIIESLLEVSRHYNNTPCIKEYRTVM